jgi:hypothetical protein
MRRLGWVECKIYQIEYSLVRALVNTSFGVFWVLPNGDAGPPDRARERGTPETRLVAS